VAQKESEVSRFLCNQNSYISKTVHVITSSHQEMEEKYSKELSAKSEKLAKEDAEENEKWENEKFRYHTEPDNYVQEMKENLASEFATVVCDCGLRYVA